MKIPHKTRRTLSGFILPNFFIFFMIWIADFIKVNEDVKIYTEFVVLPFLMGIISAWCWKDLNLKGKIVTGYSIINTMIALVLSSVLLGEGIFCLLIVSPLILGFTLTGAFVGRAMFRRNSKTLNVSVISLLLVLFVNDTLSTPHYESFVSDEVLINAPPGEVWKYVVAFDHIEEKETFWMFRAGMPMPVGATVDGHYEGAGRKCIFSNGYVFDEKIVTYKPEEDLTFEIVNQPKDPEIMGHIDILKGQFRLKDNGDGTTTLTGNSWYRLYVFPVWYYDIWAKSITRNVHLRVMEHIKNSSERR